MAHIVYSLPTFEIILVLYLRLKLLLFHVQYIAVVVVVVVVVDAAVVLLEQFFIFCAVSLWKKNKFLVV